eukprot:TRINITY_DN3259_c0_g1_i1.p1 TRINITY_DN3259_c0_g1~~TRINITY_DN3259_c0_g1_i1.p1  ORF type:complete len:236 (+),score=59.10 TRINITY_DN3259_c0_g1_i1:140-847(+)
MGNQSSFVAEEKPELRRSTNEEEQLDDVWEELISIVEESNKRTEFFCNKDSNGQDCQSALSDLHHSLGLLYKPALAFEILSCEDKGQDCTKQKQDLDKYLESTDIDQKFNTIITEQSTMFGCYNGPFGGKLDDCLNKLDGKNNCWEEYKGLANCIDNNRQSHSAYISCLDREKDPKKCAQHLTNIHNNIYQIPVQEWKSIQQRQRKQGEPSLIDRLFPASFHGDENNNTPNKSPN